MVSRVVKMIVAGMFLVAFGVFAGNSGAGGKNFSAGSNAGMGPGNIQVYTLFPTSVALGSDTTQDSLGNGKVATFGPFPLAISHSRPAFKTLQMHYAQGTMANADTIRIDYQILPTFSIGDTSATWTALDTVAGISAAASAAKFGNSTDISGKLGASIMFRVIGQHNGASVTGSRIKKKIRALFLENFVAHVNTDRL